MSINDSGNNGQPKAAPQPQPQPTGAAPQQPQQPAFDPVGVLNINQYLNRSGAVESSDGRIGQAMEAFAEVAKKARENQSLKDDFEIIRFDRDQQRVGLSSILIVKVAKTNRGTVAVVRPMLLASNAVRLRPRVIQMGMERIEVPTFPQDVFTDSYWEKIQQQIKAQKGQSILVVSAGTRLIDAEFSFEETNHRGVLRLLRDSSHRCDDALLRLAGEKPLSIRNIKKVDDVLTARLDFTGMPVMDDQGCPIRSDIVIMMNRSQRTNQNQQQNQDEYYDVDTTLNEVSMYVNLEYTPQPMIQQPVQWGAAPTPPFTPAIVITDVRQADWILASTPELYFLALSNAFRVTAGAAWATVFSPKQGLKEDPHDIGALTYLTQENKKVNTKGDTFTPQHFTDLMFRMVSQHPSFQIDIDPMGHNSRIESLLLDAAFEQSPNHQAAVDAIRQAIDNLTGNQFTPLFPVGERIAVQTGTVLARGYYLDPSEGKHDRRDLGVLEALNYSKGNIQEFMNWYRTMCDTTIPADIRLKQRDGMERLYLGNNLVTLGKIFRVQLTGKFILALFEATRKAGLDVPLENTTSVYGQQRFQGNMLVQQYAVQAAAPMGYSTVSQAGQPSGLPYSTTGTVY